MIMIKKIFILFLLLSFTTLYAVTVTVSKSEYKPFENIMVTLVDMPGNSGDWVGIFPKGSTNIWDNVKSWKHDGQVVDGNYTLGGVAVGEYEVRVFLDNSYTVLAKIEFSVKEPVYNVEVTTDRDSYESRTPIGIHLVNMPGNSGDWVGIFPKESTNVWENVKSWKHDGQVIDGNYTLRGVDAGVYEVRVFLHNSYTLLAKTEFSVEDVVYNTEINTSKSKYFTGEKISVTLTNMPGKPGDWVGIFPKGSTNAWENVKLWKHDGQVVDGTYLLGGLTPGEYEARAFLNNSYNLLAKTEFSVEDIVYNTEVNTSKSEFFTGEKIRVTLTNMPGNSGDWVGIFPKGSISAWENVKAWKHDGQVVDGTYDLNSVPIGEYEVRAFLHNSYTLLSKVEFSVVEKQLITTVKTDKDIYDNGEEIIVTVGDMLGNQRDWIGIFPVGAVSSFENAYNWAWTEAISDGNISLSGLPAGEYEVRAFFDNDFEEKASYSFTVLKVILDPTVFEDAENGASNEWIHVLGDYAPLAYNGTLVLVPDWEKINGVYINHSEYHLPMYNSIQTILEIDMGGLSDYRLPGYPYDQIGYMPHYTVGVYVKTKKGNRVMIWDSWYAHTDVDPHIADYGNGNIWLQFPSPVEQVRGWGFGSIYDWVHFRVDLEASLKMLEPDNELISVQKFLATGGFIDNITLSSQ